MKLYSLLPSFSTRGDLVSIPDQKGRIFDFFLLNQGDGKFLKFTIPTLKAQEYIKLNDLTTADFLPANINVPIFSNRAKNIFSSVFPNEASYYECLVDCQGTRLRFYLCKILALYPLINRDLSSFDSLTDGSSIMDEPIFFKTFDHKFYIARDENEIVDWVVSEYFVDLCRTERLEIGFDEVKQM